MPGYGDPVHQVEMQRLAAMPRLPLLTAKQAMDRLLSGLRHAPGGHLADAHPDDCNCFLCLHG